MTVDPSLTFTIKRAELSKSDLVLSASPGVSSLGIVSYREPSRERENVYADGSPYAPRALLASKAAPSFHALLLVPQVTTQAAEDAALAELEEALSQFSFQCIDNRNGQTRTWECSPGSMAPAGDRSRIDLKFLKPLWNVTIPCDPQ